jgi:cysteinyl-tRNA synthetase
MKITLPYFTIYIFYIIFNNIALAEESPCSSQITESTLYITNDNLDIHCIEVPTADGSTVGYQAYLKKVPNENNQIIFSITNLIPVDDNSPKITPKPDISNTDEICRDFADTYPATKGSTPPGTKWLYQLQAASIPFINQSNFDIVTIDYSKDGTDNQRYSKAEIESLHAHNKVALAYLSIGEAEDYRYYFDQKWVAKDADGVLQATTQAPCWLGLTNKDWHGNYKTQYWSESWQQILIGYLDKIIDTGFDGVYLDITDAYYYWGNPNNGEKLSNGQNLSLEIFYIAQRMINLVKRIAYHARVVRGKTNFYIFPQNGSPILEFDTDNSYLDTISGIGIEDLFYSETEEVDDDETAYRLDFIMKIKQAGKKVLLVDYVDDGSGYQGENNTRIDENKARIDDFRQKAIDEGFIPYVAISDRALETLHTIEGIQE